MMIPDRIRLCPSRRDAFTLIEMLVVIAIIVLLASLITPMVGKSLKMATRTRCMNNLRQITMATVTWATDHEGRLPKPEKSYGDFPHGFENYEEIFGDMLGARDKSMFCPGELYQVRNPRLGAYVSLFTTYQYFNSNSPFKGTYAGDKPGMEDMSDYPLGAAVWGCLSLTKGGGKSLAHHEPDVAKDVSGMNAAYLDGHVRWVSSENLEAYINIGGADYYWPIPAN